MGSGGFAGYGIHLNYRSGLNVAETDWARAKLDGVRKFARLFANQDLIAEDSRYHEVARGLRITRKRDVRAAALVSTSIPN